jgi:hypothetical protein
MALFALPAKESTLARIGLVQSTAPLLSLEVGAFIPAKKNTDLTLDWAKRRHAGNIGPSAGEQEVSSPSLLALKKWRKCWGK